jgi:NTE family protein
LGDELIVTATNKRLRKTQYFSLNKTPNMEISEAVKISASLPVVFRDTRIDGEDYNDGGVLNNFPTDAFHADEMTFLESECGNNMKTLAVQFDNGAERPSVDRIKDPVHREHFIANWIYALLTGVSDPASGWEQDLMKLRKYAVQSIIVDIGNTSATNFSVEERSQLQLIKNGYQAGKNYLKARYAQRAPYKNKEFMYSTFVSIEELLAYCCYKGNKFWFDIVCTLISDSSSPYKGRLLNQSIKLKSLYFNALRQEGDEPNSACAQRSWEKEKNSSSLHTQSNKNHEVLIALYPVFLKLSAKLLQNVKDHDLLERARHSFKATTLFDCIKYFDSIKYDMHIVLHIFINLVFVRDKNHIPAPLNALMFKKPIR